MVQNDHVEALMKEITADLREPDITRESIQNEINIKQIELEAIERKREATIARRHSVSRINSEPIWDRARAPLRIGDTVRIVNPSSHFNTK